MQSEADVNPRLFTFVGGKVGTWSARVGFSIAGWREVGSAWGHEQRAVRDPFRERTARGQAG